MSSCNILEEESTKTPFEISVVTNMHQVMIIIAFIVLVMQAMLVHTCVSIIKPVMLSLHSLKCFPD